MISYLKFLWNKKALAMLLLVLLISFSAYLFYDLIKEYECRDLFKTDSMLIIQWNTKCNNYIDIKYDVLNNECIIKCLDHLE